jgi:signal transduction histidine kinase
MFSLSRPWSHRVRLTALLTATVSIALGFVFIFVVFIVQDQALNRRFVDLSANVSRVAAEYSGPSSLAEEKEDFPGVAFCVYTLSGKLLASTTKNAPKYFTGRAKLHHHLVVGIRAGDKVFIGKSSWLETAAGLRQLAVVLALLWLPLTAITALTAWYGGGLVLLPVTELVASAEKLSGAADGKILTTTDHAEFATLADSLNQLIARVHLAASVQEQFAADAAHELRNPLALLRMRVEANLLNERTCEEHVDSQQKMIVQIDRLTAIVEALLLSARQPTINAPITALDTTAVQSIVEWAELSGWPMDRLHMTVVPCSVRVSTEEIALVLRNLLDNAGRHAPDATPIEITVGPTEEGIRLDVRDFGQGIPRADFERVFDRFYRADSGRDRQHGGNGIGLSVVKRIVEWRGGSVRVEQVPRGTLIALLFPPAL